MMNFDPSGSGGIKNTGNPSGSSNPNHGNPNNTGPAFLAGVPGYEDLPEPEPLSSALAKELAPLLQVFGENLVSALYSGKTRVLREAALTKLNMDLDSGVYDGRICENGTASAKETLTALVILLKKTGGDKIANIFLLSTHVIQSMVQKVLYSAASKYPGAPS